MNEMISHVYHSVTALGLTSVLGIGLSLGLPGVAAAQQPPYQFERTLTLESAALEHFHSRLGDGQLRITGDAEVEQIEVRALIFYYAEEDIVFSLDDIDGEGRLEGGFVGGDYSGDAPYMEVEIRLPARLSVDIRHGDGEVSVRNLEEMVTIETGVGDIDVENVGGVRIEHRSGGKISTRNINGPVQINQRS